jgi:hypothetical protein
MEQRAPVFDKIIEDYLLQIATRNNTDPIAEILGVSVEAGQYRIPYFHKRFVVGADKIVTEKGSKPSHATSVILCKYILLCPEQPDEDKTLVTYKDFKDTAPYIGGFKNTSEHPIARYFEGRVAKLEKKCLELGGRPFQTDVACQLAFRFQALPRVPLFLLFNDADEDFAAQCTLLFQKSAARYLDMECIAMVGATLATWLQGD